MTLALTLSAALLSAASLPQQSATPPTAEKVRPAHVAASPRVLPPPPASAARPRPKREKRKSAGVRMMAGGTAALREPARENYVNAMQVYPFSEGAIYQVYTAPERVTDIVLQPGEALVAVAAGDTVRWVIGDTSSGSGPDKRTHVLVKPFASGLATNLVITTDRRTYHLAATSTRDRAIASLSWAYPQDALIALRLAAKEAGAAEPVAEGLPLEQLGFDYAISGDRPPWRPLRIFDDGRQTFIEFPAAIAVGEAPPLFLVDASGGAQLVNYRMRGRFYVVDRLFERAELRLGTKKQQIVRITRAAAGKERGRS